MIPNGAVKIVLSGALPGGERWSSGFWVDPGNPALDNVELTNLLGAFDNLAKAGGGFYVELSAKVPASVTLDTMDGYQYQGGAKAAVQAQITPQWITGTGTAHLPNQCSIVMSLRTGLPGRARRGRMYLPGVGGVLSADGQLSGQFQDPIAQGLATTFGGFNSSGFGKIVVCSQTLSELIPVTDIVSDSVIDIQRRRANQLVADTTSQHAVAP